MKKHALIVIIALLATLASLACVISPTSTPAAASTPAHTDIPASTLPPIVAPTTQPSANYDGVWAAEAVTGDVITITVQSNTVTMVEIKVVVYGEGWNAYSERVHPVASPIVNGQFSIEVREAGWSTYVVGFFKDDVLVGSLRADHVHPQGLGTAAMGVNFTATRQDGVGR
jgi:hypothetical protein